MASDRLEELRRRARERIQRVRESMERGAEAPPPPAEQPGPPPPPPHLQATQMQATVRPPSMGASVDVGGPRPIPPEDATGLEQPFGLELPYGLEMMPPAAPTQPAKPARQPLTATGAVDGGPRRAVATVHHAAKSKAARILGPDTLRQAILAQEILGKPLALRQRSDDE